MRRVPLIIFGAGKVGRALVQQLIEAGPLHERRDELNLPIVAWCEVTGAVVDTHGLGPETLRATMSAQERGVPLSETPAGYYQSDLPAIVDVAGTDGCIVVDVTASPDTAPALELALQRGYSAATANKVPLTLDQATFDRLAGCRRFRYETTVGSAVPVIEALHGLLRANDRVDSIEGVLSGTLGFLCTGLEMGRPFSELVVEAVDRGYAEPDPRIDLGGKDVARKALILARTMGWRLDMHDLSVTSLVPDALAELPQAAFMTRLSELDAGFATQVEAARRDGKVLRYVAQVSGGQVTVGLQPLPQDTAIGRLRGSDNLVAFHTRCYSDEPLVLQGRGAGVDVAASGVHADIIALAHCR